MDTLADTMIADITNSPTGYAGVDGDEQWAAEVRRLARLRGATVLAHNYQLPAIQDIADHVGDSLALSRIAAEAPEDTIVFCGVHFMAETAKMLSPGKTVLIPDQRAGCSLADSITADALRAWKEGRTSRRRVCLLREHHGGREGAHRHLLHLVQRGRRGRVDRPRPRGAVLPRPIPGCPRPSRDRTQERACVGRRVPRARRDQR